MIGFASALNLISDTSESPDGPDTQHPEDRTLWSDAMLAAAILAVDPAGVGGALVRSFPGPVRDRWMTGLTGLLPEDMPVRRVPLHVTDDRLLGGLDLAATLRSGRPVAERGLLVQADGGVLVLAMAERAEPSSVARLTATLDTGEVAVERDGFALRHPSRFGVIALDEGVDWEERPTPGLRDRLALHLDLSDVSVREAAVSGIPFDLIAIRRARDALPTVTIDDPSVEALCGTALALGVESLRAAILAIRVARIHSALCGATDVRPEDAAVAARLVLGPRATRLPMSEPDPEEPEAPEPETQSAEPDQPDPPSSPDRDETESEQTERSLDRPLEDQVQDAAAAAIPLGLLAMLQADARRRTAAAASGKAGAAQIVQRGGRPMGSRRGELKPGVRVAVLDTLRVAAPWQRLRRREISETETSPRVLVRPDDIRLTRFKRRRGTVTIFAVDASGSASLNRLAEAKGAVELLLADCYVRRDEVALISFRGAGAEVLLSPTRSLTRAKRQLGVLPGGGGTPLAAGIDAAGALAERIVKQGRSVSLVFLIDGRPNVGRDGLGGRERAQQDAEEAARQIALAGFPALVVDMSARPQPASRELAGKMGAIYLPLPRADSRTLSRAVQAATAGA
ncbi:MAG: magnesium chelatase subunit D [Alphaproteobacteria bacterium]|nr:magnesium chelatase subunit D [Alphaproteobacteria bacterium]